MTVDPLADPAPAIERLPLWAQVMLAARLIRRAIGDQSAFVPACETLIDGCFGGEHGWHRGVLDVHRLPATAATGSLRAALEAALDAAFAAETSLDFSAAETACTSSALRAIGEASQAPSLNPLQARTYVVSDLDLLGFSLWRGRRRPPRAAAARDPRPPRGGGYVGKADSAMCSAIARAEVAPGEGAFLTAVTRRRWLILKSSTKVPSMSMA